MSTAKRHIGLRPRNATLVRFNVEQGFATLEFATGGRNVEVSTARLELLAAYLRARPAFGTDAALAAALGIDRTRIAAWKKGHAEPRREHVRILADLATTVDVLRRFLHPSVLDDWLTSPKVQLRDQTPVEALREGRLTEVLQAANAAEHGAYA